MRITLNIQQNFNNTLVDLSRTEKEVISLKNGKFTYRDEWIILAHSVGKERKAHEKSRKG